jgi:hypothetical protein
MTANRIENPPQAIYRSLEATSNPALSAAKAQPGLQEDHDGRDYGKA